MPGIPDPGLKPCPMAYIVPEVATLVPGDSIRYKLSMQCTLMQKFENCFGKLEATAELIYMKSSHLQIIMGDFATLVQKDKFAQLSVRAGNIHATTTIQTPAKEIL